MALLGTAQRQIHIKFNRKPSQRDNHNSLPYNINTIGDWIKIKLIEENLTAVHVAAKMGIAHAVVRSWEEGANGPGKEQIQALIGVFGDAPPLGIIH